MDSQSSNASEVPDEMTCNQDQQFVEEITSESVNDSKSTVRPFVDIVRGRQR